MQCNCLKYNYLIFRTPLERVGISYHSKNIEKYINLLVKAGYLEMTNPENPNASNQKYRKKIKK